MPNLIILYLHLLMELRFIDWILGMIYSIKKNMRDSQIKNNGIWVYKQLGYI
jgi:hypothetical protein